MHTIDSKSRPRRGSRVHLPDPVSSMQEDRRLCAHKEVYHRQRSLNGAAKNDEEINGKSLKDDQD